MTKNRNAWTALVLVCVAAAGGYAWMRYAERIAAPPVAQAPPVPQPGAAAAPGIRFPLPQADGAAPLPALEQSDSALRDVLSTLFGRSVFEALFAQRDIVRRIVATVDNLAREKAAQRLMPVRPAAGPFLVSGEGEARVIAPDNAARYAPFIAAAQAVDTGALVAAYVRHYPLFQQAYRELGYPQDYFNDRLVQVIDHLLAAPQVDGPVKLVQRKVLMEFADPELEARSAGQKILIRMGTANAERLKAKLGDIRRALAAQAPGS